MDTMHVSLLELTVEVKLSIAYADNGIKKRASTPWRVRVKLIIIFIFALDCSENAYQAVSSDLDYLTRGTLDNVDKSPNS